MFRTLTRDNLFDTFPNIDILLRNICDERPFTKMEHIKNYLRNSLSNGKLSVLAMLSINSEVLDEIKWQRNDWWFRLHETQKITIIKNVHLATKLWIKTFKNQNKISRFRSKKSFRLGDRGIRLTFKPALIQKLSGIPSQNGMSKVILY